MLNFIRKLAGQGCPNCGDTALGGLKVTEEAHRYIGELSRCGTCGLVSSDMKVITDNRVIVPHPVLKAVAAGSGQAHINVVDKRLAILVPSGKPPRVESYEIILGTTFHGDLGVSLICDVVYPLLCVANSRITNGVGARVSIGIEGYNDDPREIWEVASIIELFRRIDERIPAFIFWLTDAFRPVFLQTLAAGSNEETIAMTQALLDVLHGQGKMPAATIPTTHAGRASFYFLLVHAASRAKVMGPEALEADLKDNPAAVTAIVADGVASLDRTLARYQRK